MQYNLDKPIVELIHTGDGNFEALLSNGTIDEVNNGVSGLIIFIYFENEPVPPIGWTVTLEKAHVDYMNKIGQIKNKK